MANLNAGDILNTVNAILGAVASQGGGTSQNTGGANQNTASNQGGGTNQDAASSQGGANQNAASSQSGGTNQDAASSQNGGTNQDTASSQNGAVGLNFGDLGELAKVIQNTKFLDAEKLTALQMGLLSLATKSKLSPSVLLKLAPLIATLQTMRVNTDTAGTAPNTNAAETVPNTNAAETLQNANAAETVQNANQKAWDLIKPFLNDKDKLSSLLSLFGEYGGKLFGILKAVFLRA